MMRRELILVLLFVVGCSSSSTNELKDFYERAKSRDLTILSDLTLKPRGVNEDGSYKIHKMQYNRKKGEPLTIPVFDEETSKEEWLDSTVFDIREFATLKGMNQESAYLEVKAFSDSVLSLYNYLKVISIESYPHLGDFNVFQVNSTVQAIYIEDTSKVYNSSWKTFFKGAKPDAKYWYHRNKEMKN